MSKRLVRTGTALNLWVQAQCAKHLMMLPTREERQATCDWLAACVNDRPPGASPPEPENPNQAKLPFEGPEI